MTRGSKKSAAKQVAYAEVIKGQRTTAKRSKARWIKHSWDEKTDSLVTQWTPGFFPRASSHWHREGSIDEIEARENAGQRSMF
ncbi:hypothetical protein [Rhizobium sp. LCM 4573]|uniref:hypothetical protein n=1 Tax=Rhizobium sp. LCM 4573 TaxID=1848291 RepID=UPI0008D9C64D|nr:hypothetical protein [Rhizobium sp. LCM 4573]OHV83633.1 hypothetical protein LCM4573_05885 [Rhizobium sp. LCM 4573]